MAKAKKNNNYLLYCSYAIAILDMISAVLYAGVSARLLVMSMHWSAFVSILFSLFWFATIVLLIMGLRRRRLAYIRAWLIFTVVGIVIDGVLLVYGFFMALSLNWQGFKSIVLPFLGLAVEMTFVYIIYVFYGDMDGKSGGKKRSWCCRRRGRSKPKDKKKKKKKSKKSSSKRSAKQPLDC